MEGKGEITDAAAVVGGKRKNGHKMECCCHICENMTKKAKRGGYKADAEKRMLQKMGGSKKKNGHRMDCGCPICKNMKNAKQAKRGGGDEEEVVVEKEMMVPSGGRKKKGNGHKVNCGCPICKNMKKSKMGGEDPQVNINVEEEIPLTKNAAAQNSSSMASDEDYENLDVVETAPNVVGGTRKRRGAKKSARKNKSNGRKTRRNRKRTYKRH